MKTKEKIIAQAIATYNQKGVANVTSRELAKQLGISHGNLEYHFPNKEALLLAIYTQMREEISVAYENKQKGEEPFEAFNQLLHKLEVFQEKYLFFNLDFLEIGRNFKKVGMLLDETIQLRHEQLAEFFHQFQLAGYLPEDEAEESYRLLRHSVLVLIIFWKKQQTILPTDIQGEKKGLSDHVWNLLLPRLSEKGKGAYNNLNILSHE